ncbi:hypothetical protein GOP47_0023392 [Adiantum capillus-veneris]|uniref:Protein kinase domain-containing protein n=1 Tax=Adiantum capillus-veneris TaxID=13818 RepID=A0A9D4U3T6_ADICA|nr:hypothetical protein GOP47_0023392 [Adiantum capillus-veneris]
MGVFLLVAVQLLALLSSVASLSSDGWALLHFRSNIEDDSRRALVSWSVYDEDPCSWFGVSCESGKVTSLNLDGLSLRGTLSPELGKLVDLRELVLRGNKLTGVIPFQLGELGKLEVLDLAHNQFSGQLPEDLGNLSTLSRLYLENNNLEGVIPAELGELENLCELIISVNKLTGIIPGDLSIPSANSLFNDGDDFEIGICKLKYLQVADFSSNYFEGRVPLCLQRLPSASFTLNCLSREHLPHQRPVQECSQELYSVARRRLLQSDGVVTNQTITNVTEGPPLSISTGSPAPSPSEPVQKTTTSINSPASAPTSFDSPVPSPGMAPSPSSGSLTPPIVSSSSSSTRTSTVIGLVVVSTIVVCVAMAGVFMWLRYRRKSSAVRPWKGSMSGELHKGFTKGVPAFSRAELEAACEDFSNIIGSSPDIVLFKGTLPNADGIEIAVTSIRKSAKSWSSNSELIFWRKVECLSQMKHQNLVNLLGYCAEEEPFIRMLVFEYVPNGTVHEHLHNKDSEHLDWETRMRIIMGVANALDYMHHGFDSPVTHTKLDAKSVFLTEDFSPKVADFGVWKASKTHKDLKASSERSHDLGHDDLELSDRLIPHLETNIYEFGVFLLEMMTGRSSHSKELGSLTEWAWSSICPTGQAACIVDPSLQSYNAGELELVSRTAYDCLQSDTSRAFTMRQISLTLSSSLSSIKEPIVPKSSPLLWAELQILSQD